MNPAEANTSWMIIITLVALLAPLASSILSWMVSSRYAWVLPITSSLLLLTSSLASIVLLFNVPQGSYTLSVPWFTINSYVVTAGVLIDRLTIMMMCVVSIISFLVHVYSAGYMAGDMGLRKYFLVLGFFTFSMLGLVMADNLLLIFACWELVGFSSYLLIGHWMELPEAAKASKKAFILNRVGDLGFIIGLMIIYSQTGTFQLNLLTSSPALPWHTAASLCLFLGVMGKSAQFPLLTWLPDAMAGPTPVSALIHAATMVAAGVFLMARVFFLFPPDALHVVVIIGTITSILGAGAAIVQYDIKKILAYSTVSQLGFMMMAMGVGARDSAMLQLFTHAFFKAGLFLAVGSVIHALHQAQQGTNHHFNVQDIRNLGGLRKSLPITFLIFIICGASLAGIPFFSGFQSKDSIINAIVGWAGDSMSWKWSFIITSFVIIFLTITYTFRLIWFVFIHPSKFLEEKKLTVIESPYVMRLPMVILALGSGWWIVSTNPFTSNGWWVKEDLSHIITVVSAIWVMMSLIMIYLIFKNRTATHHETSLSSVLDQTFYIDRIYNVTFAKPLAKLSTITTIIDKRFIDNILHATAYANVAAAFFVSWIDRNIIDGIFSGVAYFSRGIGRLARSTQGGVVQYYIFWSGLGIIVLLLYLIL